MAVHTPSAIEAAWEGVLARAVGRAVDPRSLGVLVERQSRIYNGEDHPPLARADGLAVRALFWFARDLRKVALPVVELVRAGALPSRPLRVVDLGAGLGATSLGWLRALRESNVVTARIDAIDQESESLAMLQTIARDAQRAGLLGAELPPLETHVADFRDGAAIANALALGSSRTDVLMIGSALVEATRTAGDEAARGAAIAKYVRAAIEAVQLADDGVVLIIEPATRTETRALHHARAALIEAGLGVFAPCTHQGPCPMLERERDWCHEDLAADLPPWLHAVARSAGLRWEGLTFSYLVLRRDTSRSVGELVARPGFVAARLVAQPRDTKGKTEAMASVSNRGVRVMQLARDVKRAEGPIDVLAEHARGDLLALREEAVDATAPGGTLRLTPDTSRKNT